MLDQPTVGGRYVAALRDYEMLGVVADVCAAVGGQVTQRAFDGQRPEGCPCARQVCRRLGLSWAELLAEASGPDPHRRLLGRRRSRPESFSREECWVALRRVSLRLGRRVSSFEYGAHAAQALSVDRACRVHGGRVRLPNQGQIATALGAWGAVSKKAARGCRGNTPKAVAPSVALDACIEAHGVVPDLAQLAVFCEANGLVMADSIASVDQILAGLAAQRALHGAAPLPRPDELPAGPADFSEPVAGLRDRMRTLGVRDRASAVAALAACLDWLDGQPAGEHELTEQRYQRFAHLHPQWPWYSTIHRHGGINELIDEARWWRVERDRRIETGEALHAAPERAAQFAVQRQKAQAEREQAKEHVERAMRDKVWQQICDRRGLPAWERPAYDPQVVADVALPRSPALMAAILVDLERQAGQSASHLADHLDAAVSRVSEHLRRLRALRIVQPVGQVESVRQRGRQATAYRCAVTLSDGVRERAAGALPSEAPQWTDVLAETHRACLHLRTFDVQALSKTMGLSTHNTNQRLAKLLALGAVKRVSQDPRRNGAWTYRAIVDGDTPALTDGPR